MAGAMHARVIVLAGPSGSGKSRLAAQFGLPVLRLDDFYREVGDPTLPRTTVGSNAGLVDWDHPDSWSPQDAVAALAELCSTGETQAPDYDLSTSSRVGCHQVTLDGAPYVVAEGIFAQDLVPLLKERGLMASAFCLEQPPALTFWRRLVRDLREHRKPPRVLLARGVALMREQRAFVRRAVALGCIPAAPEEVRHRVQMLGEETFGQPIDHAWADHVLAQVGPQPDSRSCGAACLVVARMLRDPTWADAVLARGSANTVLDTHRRISGVTDAAGRTQLPWWRGLGTPPWTMVRELGRRGPRRCVRFTFVGRMELAQRVRSALDGGHSVPWYVGSRWLPRHIVLVVGYRDNTWHVFEPSRGRLIEVPEDSFTSDSLRVAGWRRTWALVLPRVR